MSGRHMYHAPAACPVCGDQLITTRKGCLHCGTEIAGEFAACEFCALAEADIDLLRVFLGSRGNLREVAKHLQVSYPTARTRLDGVLAKLGLTPPGDTTQGDPAPPSDDAAGEDDGGEYGEEVGSAATPEEQILARVSRGELSPEVAAQLLGG